MPDKFRVGQRARIVMVRVPGLTITEFDRRHAGEIVTIVEQRAMRSIDLRDHPRYLVKLPSGIYAQPVEEALEPLDDDAAFRRFMSRVTEPITEAA